MRIYLIGFMCCGKTTVGRALAARMGLPFKDIDRVIEEQVGPLVPFFREHGEQAFRAMEREALHAMQDEGPMVVACGGGTPCEGDNMATMQHHGKVVWLDLPFQTLMERITRSGGDRPLLLGLAGEALRERVQALLAEREDCYAAADAIVQADAAPEIVSARVELAIKALQER